MSAQPQGQSSGPQGFGAIGSPSNWVNSEAARLAAVASTNSVVFVNLLSRTITTVAGTELAVWATMSGSLTNIGLSPGTVQFRIRVDMVTQLGAGSEWGSTFGPGGNFVFRVSGLGAGLHTVLIQWRVVAGTDTARIRPVGAPDTEHASILVAEVAG